MEFITKDYVSTPPQTEWEKAVIARARQLTDFKWTPVRDVPSYIGQTKEYMVLPAGVEIKGFPYASTEGKDKFFTENVSFETFLSAIPNPYSKLYQPGTAAYNACSYGIVCNGLARYALGIERRVSTARWLTIPGMRVVGKKGCFKAEDIKLCDNLWAFGEGRNHVALITDILKDNNGKTVAIEVSEAIRPHCTRRIFDVEYFFEKWNLYSLCRYEPTDKIPPLDEESNDVLWNSSIEKITPKITVDNGNKSNYLVGDPTLISVNSDSSDKVMIYKDGELVESFNVGAKAFLVRNLSHGYYKIMLERDGASVEFAVNRAKLSYTVSDGNITVNADPCDDQSIIVYADFRQAGTGCASLEKYEELTDEEKQSGTYTRPIPDGAENFKVYFKNPYGVWTHPMIKIEK